MGACSALSTHCMSMQNLTRVVVRGHKEAGAELDPGLFMPTWVTLRPLSFGEDLEASHSVVDKPVGSHSGTH